MTQANRISPISFGAAAASAFAALSILAAAAYAWVALYSHWLAPGHDLDFYRHYARQSSPIVGIVAGMPLFWFAGRQLGARFGVAAALLSWGIFAAAGLVVTIASGGSLTMCAIDLPLKLGMTWWGARVGRA